MCHVNMKGTLENKDSKCLKYMSEMKLFVFSVLSSDSSTSYSVCVATTCLCRCSPKL